MAKQNRPKPSTKNQAPGTIRRDARRLILEAARKRFLSDGVRKTSIESIVSDIKVSKKTLYALFDSKQEIWSELMRIDARKTCEYLKTHLPTELSPLQRLERLVGFILRRRLQANTEARERDLVSSLIGTLPAEPPEDTSKRLRDAALQQAFPMLVEELIREYHSKTNTDVDVRAPDTISNADLEIRATVLAAMVVGAVIGGADAATMSSDFVKEVCSAATRIVQISQI